MLLSTRHALRYVAPLREGGSLPAIVETDGGSYVVKFRGAGQGARALLAELIVGGIAQALGLPLPDLAVVELGDGFGRAEPDPEIQDILRGSAGPNVGLGYLEGAFPYDPVAAADLVSPRLASEIVWLDALTTNIDRTARNPNLLIVREAGGPALYLIDHGAALYFHHDWSSMTPERARAPFPAIRDHVLLPLASEILDVDADLAPLLTDGVLADVLDAVPDALLMDAPPGREAAFATPAANRAAYAGVLRSRLEGPRAFAEEAARAHETARTTPAVPLGYRR